jgi:hypothetical protein
LPGLFVGFIRNDPTVKVHELALVDDLKPDFRNGGDQIMHIEPVLLGVIHPSPPKRMGNVLFQNLLGVKTAARFQHPVNFRQRFPPVDDVMDGAECKHSIVSAVKNGQRPGVADPQPGGCLWPMPAASRTDHFGIQVEGVDAIDPENIPDDAGAVSGTTAHLQSKAPVDHSAHPPELPGFEVLLNQRSDRVAHQQLF